MEEIKKECVLRFYFSTKNGCNHLTSSVANTTDAKRVILVTTFLLNAYSELTAADDNAILGGGTSGGGTNSLKGVEDL